MAETNSKKLKEIREAVIYSKMFIEDDGTLKFLYGENLLEDIEWLIEQAERTEIYQKALMEIGAKYQPPTSKIANDALWIADYRRNG